MTPSAKTTDLMNRLLKFGVDAFRTEFIAQGHNATNYAINNIRGKIEAIPDGLAINFCAPAYATKLNNWQSPSTIHINEWRLRVWMSLPTRNIPQGAYRPITAAMMREGIPTKGSFKFSKNGRRTGWISVPANDFIFPAADELGRQIAKEVLNKVTEDFILQLRDL